MNIFQTFKIQGIDFNIREISSEDISAVQTLFIKCSDYFQIVDGGLPKDTEAEELFHSFPMPEREKDRFIYGIFMNTDLIALIEGLKDYPNKDTWWIGLLLVNPEFRQKGIGTEVINLLIDNIRIAKGTELQLGVVEDNISAYKYWQKKGFAVIRQTEPRKFGKKTQQVYVFSRLL